MKLLETSFLVDYENGRESARRYFEAHEHESLVASTISTFELAFGVVWSSSRDLSELRESLAWLEFVEFSVEDALEGARVQAELQSAGNRLPIGATLIAGVGRNRGATLVTGDDHFAAVDGLDVENHRK